MRILDIAAGRIPSETADIDALRPHAVPHEAHLTPEEFASGIAVREHQRLTLDVIESNE
jgi:hypothetical protein